MAGQTTNYLFDYPTSTDYVKDGATAIETLADDVDATLFTALGGAYPGLRSVKKQTIGTGVSSVTVTDAFSATYQNYKIQVVGSTAAADNNYVLLKLNGSAGSTYNFGGFYVIYNAAGVNSVNGASVDSIPVGATGSQTNTNFTFDIFNPFNANHTTTYAAITSQGSSWIINGIDKNAASHTAFTLSSTTTLTGGTIYVYGYGAS